MGGQSHIKITMSHPRDLCMCQRVQSLTPSSHTHAHTQADALLLKCLMCDFKTQTHSSSSRTHLRFTHVTKINPYTHMHTNIPFCALILKRFKVSFNFCTIKFFKPSFSWLCMRSKSHNFGYGCAAGTGPERVQRRRKEKTFRWFASLLNNCV